MIRTWKKIGAGMILCIFMAGCGSQNEVYLETEVSQDTGNPQETEEPEAGERLDILDVSGVEQTGSVDLSEVSGEEWAAEVALAPETTEDADKADRVWKMLCLCLRRGGRAGRVCVRAWRPHL